MLDQTYGDFELVVLDNANTDGTLAIARSFEDPRVRIVTNRQCSSNRTIGAKRSIVPSAIGQLLCADDLLHPRCLELQVPPLVTDPGVALPESLAAFRGEPPGAARTPTGVGPLSSCGS